MIELLIQYLTFASQGLQELCIACVPIWVGGMLTNFTEIRKRITRLNELVAHGESGELERKYTKKERVIIGNKASRGGQKILNDP